MPSTSEKSEEDTRLAYQYAQDAYAFLYCSSVHENHNYFTAEKYRKYRYYRYFFYIDIRYFFNIETADLHQMLIHAF